MITTRALPLVLALAVLTASGPAQTGTFLDRAFASDLRIVCYNPLWDTIFPTVDPIQADKFERIVDALDPDILALQEINQSASSVVSLLNSIAPITGGGTWYAHKGSDCVIASKFPLSLTATNPVPAGDGALAMALVDLPDAQFNFDLYMMNDHFPCCGGNDPARQEQADALANWMRDARLPGGSITLPSGTAMMVLGDLNIVGGPQPLDTLIDGNIIDESTYGPDSPPDWDGSDNTDAHPLHNVVGPDDYTWRNDNSSFPPGRLDFVIYTDSILTDTDSFVLNTTTMTPGELSATGLQQFDVTLDGSGSVFDHLPLVFDFRVPTGGLPGSGEDFALETLVNGVGPAGQAQKTAATGDLLDVSLLSPGGTFVGTIPLLAADAFTPGMPPVGSGLFPEVHVSPTEAEVIYAAGNGLLGPALLPSAGVNLLYVIPGGLTGAAVRLQGFALSGGAINGIFAASVPHDVTFQ